MLPDPRRCLLLAAALGIALGVCGCAGMGGPGGAAPGFFDHVAGALSNLGDHTRAAGAAIAPASPHLGAALLAIGGGLSTIGTYWGAALLRRRLRGVAAADVLAALTTPRPVTPAGQVQTATPQAPTSTTDVARVDSGNPIPVTPILASPKAKRRRARRRAAPAPFSARIAPAQTSGRAAA